MPDFVSLSKNGVAQGRQKGENTCCLSLHQETFGIREFYFTFRFLSFPGPQICIGGRPGNGCLRNEEPLACHQCGRSYQMRHNLVKHLRFECGGRKHFACSFCPARYTQNGKLRQHMLNAHNIFIPPRKTWTIPAYS